MYAKSVTSVLIVGHPDCPVGGNVLVWIRGRAKYFSYA